MKKALFLTIAGSSFLSAQTLLFQQKPLASDYFTSIDAISSSNTLQSNFTDNSPVGIFCADDFQLPQDSKITKVKFTGHIENGFLDVQNLTSWIVLFYQDNGGMPKGYPWKSNSTIQYSFTFAKNAAVTMTVDAANPKLLTVEYNLLQGSIPTPYSYTFKANTTYWVSINSIVNTTPADDANFFSAKKHFYWAASTSNLPNLGTAKIIDPSDLYHGSYTNWTDINSVSSMMSGLAFELYGSNVLATEEVGQKQFKVFPNPTTDNITVSTAGKKITGIGIYSMEGKLLKKTNETVIDLKTLPIGTYLIKMDFADGTTADTKIIKK